MRTSTPAISAKAGTFIPVHYFTAKSLADRLMSMRKRILQVDKMKSPYGTGIP